MNSYEIGTAVGNVVGWVGIVLMILVMVWIVGAIAYFTYMSIRDIPNRRATDAMNARVDAIRAANRAKVNQRLHELYGTPLVAAQNDRKWYELVGRRD